MSPFWQMICFVIISAILVGLSVVTGFIAQQKWSEWKKKSEPQSGVLSGRIIDENLDYIMIFGAATNKQIKGETLKKGIDLIDSSPVKIEGVTFPIKLYEENKSIMVDASVFDANNKTICQIVKNNWTVHPEGYQLNNSVNALEIVDENLMPILQLYFQEPNKIYIGGAFFDKNGKRWNFLLDGITDVDIQSQTLFKYPSSQYWGQLNENNPFLDLRKLSKEIQEHRDAIKKLPEAELKKEVMSTVSQIREFLYNAAIDNAKLLNKKLQQNRLEENENEKNNLFKIHIQEGINRKRDFDVEYDSHFAAKSIAFKDELVLRLIKIHNIEIKSPIEYEIPGYYHKEIVADNLEYFVKMLNAHSLSAQQICDRAFTLVAELRKFNSHLKKEDDLVSLEEDREMKEAKTEEEKNIIWNKYRNQSSERSAKADFEYNKKFKIDAIIIKQLLPSRPPKIEKYMEDSLFERPMIPMSLNEIASYIELSAIYLKEAYNRMSNEELKKVALDHIDQLREFKDGIIKERDNLMKERDIFFRNMRNPDYRRTLNQEDINKYLNSNKLTELNQEDDQKYYNNLLPYAIIFRDELSHRIGESHENKGFHDKYNFVRVPDGIDEIIKDLERLVKKLS